MVPIAFVNKTGSKQPGFFAPEIIKTKNRISTVSGCFPENFKTNQTNLYYSLEMNHNGYYGMLRYKNGTYDGIYMEFSQKHDGTFGAITNQSAIDALKAKYGVTKFGIGNDRCVYTKTFE